MQKQSPRPPEARTVAEQPAPHPSVLRILVLAQRMAARYVSGKHGLAIENAANEVLHLWDELPAEIRVLL
jgi:hypothetical protein